MFVPPRDANAIDLIANTAGAALGGLARESRSRARRPRSAASCRCASAGSSRGRIGDFGPRAARDLARRRRSIRASRCSRSCSIRRRSSAPPARSPVPATPTSPPRSSRARTAPSSCWASGCSSSLLLRERRNVGGAVLLLIGAALLAKGVAALFLLKPAVWERWLSPGVSTGVAAGALLLLAAISLPRPAQVAVATVALLLSLLTTLLAPDLLFARPPLSMFSWSYGHLLHFNGLTHIVLLVWPLARERVPVRARGAAEVGRSRVMSPSVDPSAIVGRMIPPAVDDAIDPIPRPPRAGHQAPPSRRRAARLAGVRGAEARGAARGDRRARLPRNGADARSGIRRSRSCIRSTGASRIAARCRSCVGDGRLWRALRSRHYDLVVHLTEHPRGAWLTRIAGAR